MLINLDLATVLLLHNTSLLVGAFVFFSLKEPKEEVIGLRFLAVSFLLLTLGTALAGLGELGIINFKVWTNISLLLGVLGYSFFWYGISYIIDIKRKKYPLYYLFIAPLFFIILEYLTDFTSINTLRATAFHGNAVLFLLLSLWEIYKSYSHEHLRSKKTLAFFIALGMIMYSINFIQFSLGIEHTFSITFLLLAKIPCNFAIALMILLLIKERSEEQLKLVAQTDYLTGIGTRRWFFEKLPETIPHNVAIAILDIDYFKKINDTFGHLAGDYVLATIAKFIKESLREHDIVARYGGEEFIIYCQDILKEDAQNIAHRIIHGIESLELTYNSNQICMTASIGLVFTSNCEDVTWATMLEKADNALYQAKEEGRNRVILDEENSY